MVLSVLISIECKQSKQENGMKKGAAKTIRTNKKQRLVNITFFFLRKGVVVCMSMRCASKVGILMRDFYPDKFGSNLE